MKYKIPSFYPDVKLYVSVNAFIWQCNKCAFYPMLNNDLVTVKQMIVQHDCIEDCDPTIAYVDISKLKTWTDVTGMVFGKIKK